MTQLLNTKTQIPGSNATQVIGNFEIVSEPTLKIQDIRVKTGITEKNRTMKSIINKVKNVEIDDDMKFISNSSKIKSVVGHFKCSNLSRVSIFPSIFKHQSILLCENT